MKKCRECGYVGGKGFAWKQGVGWVCARKHRAAGTRPFRLVHTTDGLMYEPWAAYGSLDSAQGGLEKAINPTDEKNRKMNLLIGGWFVILNVGAMPRKIEQAVGIGRCKDKPLPEFRRIS